jgi:proteasome lid subunit RPN8/RPN11
MRLPAAKDGFSLADFKVARAIGSIYKGAPIVVIHEPVLEQIIEYSETGRSREVGGFLLGGTYGEDHTFVVVRHFHPAIQALSGSASLTFTHETWADLNRQVEQRHPGEMVLGWQHTHPGFGIFLSGYDMFIHRHFFPQPHQVALVVDPQRQELGFFQWREGEVKDCGFVCAEEPLRGRES